jgi:hypothetical protein
MKFEFSRQILEKVLNIKFHQNPSSGNRVVPCGQTDRRANGHDKLIVAVRNFANAPKNSQYVELRLLLITRIFSGLLLCICEAVRNARNKEMLLSNLTNAVTQRIVPSLLRIRLGLHGMQLRRWLLGGQERRHSYLGVLFLAEH